MPNDAYDLAEADMVGQGGTITVEAGDGDNQVLIDEGAISSRPNLRIVTGLDADNITVLGAGGQVTAEAGDGHNTVTVRAGDITGPPGWEPPLFPSFADPNSVIIRTGTGVDDVYVNDANGDVDIEVGDGVNTVDVTMRLMVRGTSASIVGGANADTITLARHLTKTMGQVSAENSGGTILVDAGDGTNSMSLSIPAEARPVITIIGGSGADNLELLRAGGVVNINLGGQPLVRL